MCSHCTDVHRKDRRNSKHRISSVGELRNGNVGDEFSATGAPSCQTHPAESASFYCLTCDVSVCKDCTPFHHRAPKHKVMKDTRGAARERRGVIDKMLVIAEKRSEEFERAQELVENTEKGIHARLHRAKKAIDQEADEKVEIIKKERNYELIQLTTKMMGDGSDSSRRSNGNPLSRLHQAKDEINATADAKIVKIDKQRAELLNKVARLQEDRGHDLQEAMINVHGLTQRAKYSNTLAMILLKEAGDNHFLSLYMMLGKALKALIKTKPIDVDQRLEIVTYSKSESVVNLGRLSETIESWLLVKTYGKRDSDDFKCALGVAACPNGDIVLADEGHKRVVIFGLDGEFKQKLQDPKKSRGSGDDQPQPCGVAVNSLGHCIVVDKTKSVKVYDDKGKYVDEFDIDIRRGQSGKAVCVAVDAKDRILIGDKSRSLLTIHSPDGTLIERLELNLNPWFLAVNSREQIIICDFDAGKIVAIDYSGAIQFTMETIVDGNRIRAAGICCDSNDDIFVSLHSGDEKGSYPICQYNPRGKFLGCVATGLYNPLGLAFTADGKLAIADTSSVKLYQK